MQEENKNLSFIALATFVFVSLIFIFIVRFGLN